MTELELALNSLIKPAQPLAPYTTCTHVGNAYALALPDGDGDLVLVAANRPTALDSQGILRVHGIAASQNDRPVTNGRKLKVKATASLVEFVHLSQVGKDGCRLMMKDTTHAIDALAVTTIGAGQSVDFTYDEKLPGWRQA